MYSPDNYNPYRRILISGEGLVLKFRSLLPMLTKDVNQAFHELMYALVEAVRYRDKAMQEIVEITRNLARNVATLSVVVNEEYASAYQDIVRTVRDLALSIFYQCEEHRLYDDRGVLQFTYFPNPDPYFPDIILNGVVRLTYNPTVPCYEPPTS